MLLQVAFRTDDALGGLLRLTDGLVQVLDLLVDVFHRLGTLVEAGETPSELVDLAQRAGYGLFDLLERLVRLRELRGAHRHLRQHFAERAALFLGRDDQCLKLVGGRSSALFSLPEPMPNASNISILPDYVSSDRNGPGSQLVSCPGNSASICIGFSAPSP